MTLQALAEGFSRAEPPDWIDIYELTSASPALIPLAQGGIHYLPGDRQIRWDGNFESDYGLRVPV